jgi:D-amino-acid dehydrogenase
MNPARSYDVAIIGGGVIGLCCALHLLRGGQSVVILEKNHAGAGASHGNCGTITPSHALPLAKPGMVRKALCWMLSKDAPFYVRPRFDAELIGWMLRFAGHCNWDQVRIATRDRAALLNLSRQLMEDLIRSECIECEFAASGAITVFRDEKTFADSRHLETMLAEVDVPMEVWSGEQVLQREPALKPGVVAGHWFPGDAVIRPDRFVAALAQLVRAQGGEIRESSSVERFDRGSGDKLLPVVAGIPVQAHRVLICGGAWSPAIAAGLGIKVPVQPGKGYSITYDRPARSPSIPLVLRERSVCVTAWGSGFRLGSTMEFSGYDESLNRTRLDALVRGANEYLHEAHGANMQEEWYGWRPMTHDDLPIIGPSTRLPNLWFATGHGMLGMSMSVATGQCLADLMLGRKPAIATAAFSPSRFGI